MPSPSDLYLHHVAIYSADRDRAAKFYEEAFGFQADYAWPRAQAGDFQFELNIAGLRSPDGRTFIEIFQVENSTPRPAVQPRGVNHFAFWVPDCRAAYDRAMQAGASLYAGSDSTGKQWDGSPVEFVFEGTPATRALIAFLVAPDGEVIELFQDL